MSAAPVLQSSPGAAPLLPPRFEQWFDERGWRPRRHQLEMVEKGREGRDVLLIAPTGGGKTLAGFLPSLIELSERAPRNVADGEGAGIHTLYISPLKALATDVHRNLELPIAEMGLKITVEARTGDTPQARRARQRVSPPDILLTTPEQLALFCAWEGAREYFKGLRCVILDEIHAIHGSKRGDLLSLGLARLATLAPQMRRVGLSATVNDPDMLRRWLSGLNPPLRSGGGGAAGIPDATEGAAQARRGDAAPPPPCRRSPSPASQGRIVWPTSSSATPARRPSWTC